MNKTEVDSFKPELETYYLQHGRHDLPWRVPEPDGSFDPYKIMVSELMLQQTQVPRVIPKYHEFLARFPTVQQLANAKLADVIVAWSGLGYNRRAKFLWLTAHKIVTDFDGTFPDTIEQLITLPGVGRNTAGAIRAYAFNKPVVFVETNIRTVYIHHFFNNDTVVSDAELLPLIAQTLDKNEPRLFYWMLMDYGSFLKKTVGNAARRSKHHTVQSPFEGSLRQTRGAVIRTLSQGPMTHAQLRQIIQDTRLATVLAALKAEGMITSHGEEYRLA